MKALLLGVAISLTTNGFAQQITNNNTLNVQIDGKAYTTQPRRVRIGTFWWITANSTNPDKSLRVWLGSYDGTDALASGTYLVVDADKAYTKDSRKRAEQLGKYKGIAAIKYVEETRSPRMEYKVGKSQNNDEIIEVKVNADGTLEATFGGSLAGSLWKEKAAATVFGGMGRLIDKAQDKAVTKTTGYDSDIDPEGNGYRKTSSTDDIVLTNGTFKLKLN
ncbi:hypothetical protein [Spirosoma montaniterrae]|uniref:Uncharacterized protein n=1 Tax=Spirosoma montaniterrae TaxID=1178516 RepID=A0A1P9X2V4_9BACT|nr:hypothetical protein [Spirosoma montaniterrae]AQG81949.1 hypothetical protein AWR27_23220 [Spirosoma montaniterrae]